MASFQVDLQQPQNQIKERAGTPAVDNSTLMGDIQAGIQATGKVFDALKVNEGNAIRSATTTALYNSIDTTGADPTTALIQDHPQMQSLNSTAQSVQQGNASPMALAIQKVAITKELNQQFPGYADIIDNQVHRVTGTSGYQDFVKQTLAPSEAAAEQQKQLVTSAISSGTVVLGANGQIDTNASIQALIQHNASAARATEISQKYENQIHTQEMYNTQMGSEVVNNIHDKLAQSFNNAVNSPEFQQIKAIPEAGQRNIALQNWFSHFQGQFEAATDEQINRIGVAQGPNPDGTSGQRVAPGLTIATQKAIQEERAVVMEGYKRVVLDGVSPMEAVGKLADMAKNNGVIEAWRSHPEILQMVDNLGGLASPLVQGNAAGISPVGTQLIGNLQSAIGQSNNGLGPSVKKYQPASQTWLDNLSFTNKITTNPKTLAAAVSTGDTSGIPATVNTARTLANNSNENTPKQDLAYNNTQQNLTNLALKGELGTQDLLNNIKEITQPIHINALLQSKAKQYNPSINEKSIGDTVASIEKGFEAIPKRLNDYVQGGMLKIDPNTQTLQVSTKLTQPGALRRLTQGFVGGMDDVQAVSNAKTYNQMVDGYVKLKASTDFKSLSDMKIRELINQRYLPDLVPPPENAKTPQ